MKLAALLLVGACGFPTLPKLGGDDAPHRDAAADTTAPDAGACTAASVECASSSTLRSCSGAGASAVDTTCSWGCITTGNAHCGLLQPTGGAVTTNDTDPTTLATLNDITISGPTTINGDNGSMGTTRPSGVGVMNGIDYEVSASGVAIFRMKSLMISAPITVLGMSKVAIVVDGPLVLTSVIDDRGSCQAAISPGGFAGGPVNGPGAGQGGGSHGSGVGGAGGAGYGGLGAMGGLSSGGSGGGLYGDPLITVLVGGSGGGGGNVAGTVGGHGGGAIQLISNGILTIGPGGGINAGGCGGHAPAPGTVGGGGGGGAGGAIVLEGKTVNIVGALAVNGGGGAGGGNSAGSGSDGGLDRNLVAGGFSNDSAAGGAGAAAQARDGFPGMSGTTTGGGGGGGLGRIRVNTQSASATIDANAILSPGPNDPSTTFTQGPAIVR